MHYYQKILIIFLLVFSIQINLLSQEYDKKYSLTELQSDFIVLRNRYEKNLSNLYLYCSKFKLDKIFDSLYTNLIPMTGMEFYSYITPLSSVIKDGHSNIYPNKILTEKYNQLAKFFPFNIYWTEQKMFISKNLSNDSTIQNGTEILSINGVSVIDLINYLLTRQVRDGKNENYALWIINNYFREYYSYHYGHPDKYFLSIKNKFGIRSDIVVEALPKSIISLNKSSRYPSQQIEFFRIDSLTNSLIFTIKSWDSKELKKEIDLVISLIQQKKINNLILDLRDNQGGNTSTATYLLSYLLNEDFQYFTGLNSVIGKTDSSQVLMKKNNSILNIKKCFKYRYKGKVFVLINGGSFSNTASFCSRLEFNNRAIFIGEETGGNKVVFSGVFGLKEKTILPHTKIICDNSNYQMIVTDIIENTGHGIVPNYKISPLIYDILNETDTVLLYALELIKQKK